MSSLACIMLLYFLQENTKSTMGAVIGLGLGFATCACVQVFNIRLLIRKQKTKQQALTQLV